MKAILVVVFAILTAATALAFGNRAVGTSVSSVAAHVTGGSNEPVALLLSGSALLGLAGAVKRFTF